MSGLISALFGLIAVTGWASHYAPGVMDWQVDYHGLSVPCDGCAVASVSCDDIGEYWLVTIGDEVWPVVVADCAGADGTIEWMEGNNIIVELSYELAEQADCVGGGCRVTVWR